MNPESTVSNYENPTVQNERRVPLAGFILSFPPKKSYKHGLMISSHRLMKLFTRSEGNASDGYPGGIPMNS